MIGELRKRLEKLFPSWKGETVKSMVPVTRSKFDDNDPTTMVPGSPEKLAVLEERARRKQAIFHTADATFPGDLRSLEFLRTTHSVQRCG